MAPALDTLQRRFAVHAAAEAPACARLVDGVSFEDAALHFLEDSHPDAEGETVQLFVEDCESGERQCFCVDLETGDAAPCD
ncbi:DUF5961 family protein [Phenylobacterium sp.]|uniref:DUF5961 family protein n=1 Tax=Phenylobacterium sp. TaxID=1871053 RepID=UPI00391D3A61